MLPQIRLKQPHTNSKNTNAAKKFPGSDGKSNSCVCRSQECDLTPGRDATIIDCTSLLWRAKQARVICGLRASKDGAKIYFCNRRCCFLTWKRRSGLLNRLSPRKSRFQSHPAKVRSVPER